ncbi:hypothetical protein [Cetobacterium sp. ZOR0034]|uniref:hypothetical protein n=1 Tax=Cetobacterium sp. ZOR0034 TaxID=1339239 RepID=UPI0006479FE9|nr:hypothetical protein [Cetobacterium sp. ZOR0034]
MEKLITSTISFEGVINNLKELIGQKFDENDIIIAFEDYEENNETEVIISNLENGRGEYSAHINTEKGTEIIITVENGIIINIRS